MKSEEYKGYMITTDGRKSENGRWTAAASFSLNAHKTLSFQHWPDEYDTKEDALKHALLRVRKQIDSRCQTDCRMAIN